MLNPSLYGSLIAIAILVCLLLIEKKAKANNIDPKLAWDIALTGLVCGIVGARAYHVVDFWQLYSDNPQLIWQIWNGGLGIWGGIIGAMTGIFVYLKLRKIDNIWYWFDLFALYLPLGQAIGRWGNYFNQENFGLPTMLPWKIYIQPQLRPLGFETAAYYHPLFLYESVLDLALFFFLGRATKKYNLGTGKIFALYLISYSVIRFLLEFLRINPWKVSGADTAQILCVIAFGFGVWVFKRKHL